ncbi:DUF222 domain-containing protein [Amycolatopsis sp. H20-H5]|uniref:DUF222 domain-containing protein n=1 Tax=Amycolatopsis sp. H20-H5 TaxID=3046309 RepID=UPI002DBD94B1|nr:DUF222 domain-containing protein [Amycolatopsis sp. H20-H5]MEC3979796.1 DUF222 domain-containing protein [Amycolatopsis sp. H20-H5]
MEVAENPVSPVDETEQACGEVKEALRVMCEARAQIARLEAVVFRAQARLNEARGRSRAVATEIALALAVTENHARSMVATAEALTNRLPRTLELMDQGLMDGYRAARISATTSWLSVSDARAVDEILAGRLVGKNAYQVRRLAYYEANKADPDGAARRMSQRRERRRLILTHHDDGLASLSIAGGPVEKVTAAYAQIDRVARALLSSEEPRTLEQLRADVALDSALASPEGGAVRAEVFLYMDMNTYLGLNNDPGELRGHGHIPAALARYIATGPDSVLRRMITDPLTGQIVELGRTSYETSAAVEDFIRVRDRECRKPGCCRPAKTCRLGHGSEPATDGLSAAATTVGLCPSDRRLKNEPGWSFSAGPAGSMTISTPAGDSYSSDPEPFHSPRIGAVPADPTSAGDAESGDRATGGDDSETAA